MSRGLKPKVILLWLLIGILLPLLLQHFSADRFEKNHGVTVSHGEGSWYELTFQRALDELSKHSGNSQEITGFVWNHRRNDFLLVLKGNAKCVVMVDEVPVLRKMNPIATAIVEFPAGFSRVRLKLNPGPSNVPVTLAFLWSSNLTTSKPLAAEVTYLAPVSKSVVLEERIANLLVVIARVNMILLLFWILWTSNLFGLLRKEQKTAVSLPAIVALIVMFALRFAGILYQVEEALHPDELLYGSMIQQIRLGNLAPTQFWYTTGYFYITAAVHKLAEWIIAAEIEQHLIQRIVSALCSFLTCIFVFKIGSTLMNRRAGMIAMILFGFSFLPIELAHIGIVEPTMVFFFTLALASLAEAYKNPSVRKFIIAGIFAGAAIAVKQTAALIGLPLLIAWIFLWIQKKVKALGIKEVFTWAFGALLGFAVLSPATLLDFNRFYQYQRLQARSLEGASETRNFFLDTHRFGWLAFEGLHNGIGYPLMLAALAGIFLIWKRSREAGWFLVPPTLWYLLLISKVVAVPEHYVLLLCPLLSLLAAAALDAVTSFPIPRWNWLIPATVVLLLIPDFQKTWTLQKLLHQTDTRRQAERWCYQNLPASSKIDHDLFGPRFLIPVFDVQRVRLFSRPNWKAYAEKRDSQFYVQDDITSDIFLNHPENFPREKQWFDSIAKGKLIKQFDGEKFYLLNPQIKIYDVSQR